MATIRSQRAAARTGRTMAFLDCPARARRSYAPKISRARQSGFSCSKEGDGHGDPYRGFLGVGEAT
jgi:hypothetical protein